MDNTQNRIDQVKAFLTISKQHLADGITYADRDINDHIAGLELQLSVLKDPTFMTAIANIIKK
jgi:hypothetical protein|tara:strand:+ start:307 stop:495 length:189 start_codon:yes stop_codon:yes gene_type:complete